MDKSLAGLLVTATAAAALAGALAGPVVQVMGQVKRGDHVAVRKFRHVADTYRQALAWSDLD